VEAAPLAVCIGLNDPQVADGVQLQSTPAFELSFETVAATDDIAPGLIVGSGEVVIAIEVVTPVVLLEFE
jgi:hypothetical protein